MPLSIASFYAQISVRQIGNQIIPNNVITAVTFDTADFDIYGLWKIAQPTRVNSPNNTNFCRVVGNVLMTNDVGSRRITFRKNGNPFPQSPASGRPAPAFGSLVTDHNGCVSGWFPIVGGTDYLEMYVQQDTGINVNIGGGGGCWAFVEFKT